MQTNDGRTGNADLGKALCIITGASKGFGRSLAQLASPLLRPGSVMVLVARSGDKLREVQSEISGTIPAKDGLEIRCVEADLGRKEGLQEVVRVVSGIEPQAIDHVLLINNASALGDVSRFAADFTCLAEVDSYLSFNVSSMLCLTASVLKAFPRRDGLRRSMVNVSSLCALQPFKSWSLYCMGKAAREMLFRVLAEEEPDVRVLNYAPGPLDTDMQLEARSLSGDLELRQTFNSLHASGQLLSCSQSATKLMQQLLRDEFESGAHIDYYDV
ncbi:Sepiapterin reductase [Acipenser ruthenus]|uniref:Sepiapterin reductase n=1 Tax=Acipenser ruthenus TaxID=7906 RepID=A0A444UUD7_ACIRT|nr:Sepiapterin reductase [Acipenser ruthenus]